MNNKRISSRVKLDQSYKMLVHTLFSFFTLHKLTNRCLLNSKFEDSLRSLETADSQHLTSNSLYAHPYLPSTSIISLSTSRTHTSIEMAMSMLTTRLHTPEAVPWDPGRRSVCPAGNTSTVNWKFLSPSVLTDSRRCRRCDASGIKALPSTVSVSCMCA